MRNRLLGNLRATGKEFWPTGQNVMEAVKTRDKDRRTRLLTALSELAGDNHALPLPTEGLRKIAEAVASGNQMVDWSEPRFTALFREPESVSDDQAAAVRDHLIEQERSFKAVHARAAVELKDHLQSAGGRSRWPKLSDFLDEVWTVENHLSAYVTVLWKEWKLGGDAPVKEILAHDAWRLFFDGWGATVYSQLIAHPQPGWVETSDLQQLVYFGSARGRVLATEDRRFHNLANAILKGRYRLARVVWLDEMVA